MLRVPCLLVDMKWNCEWNTLDAMLLLCVCESQYKCVCSVVTQSRTSRVAFRIFCEKAHSAGTRDSTHLIVYHTHTFGENSSVAQNKWIIYTYVLHIYREICTRDKKHPNVYVRRFNFKRKTHIIHVAVRGCGAAQRCGNANLLLCK